MGPADPIRARAEADNIPVDASGRRDVFLWEHVLRVTHAALQIVRMNVAGRAPNTAALQAAGLYHDVGWAIQCRDAVFSQQEILTKPTSDLQRELGAARLMERLHDLLPPRTLELAANIVRQMNERSTDLLEAQILSEAENLDGVGMMGLWQTVRRHACEGRGIQAAIDIWRRQQDYRFWEARIHEAFRFEPVRTLARARLEIMYRFYDELARIQSGEDLAALLTSAEASSPPPT
ncbi:MAG TPA: HD domain-containing protein [Phycisphaerae bacterium]|jgi:HD superfamily phosphodiesterase